MRKAVIPAVLIAVGAAGVLALALALGPSGDSPPAPAPPPPSPAPPPPDPPRTAETANPRIPARAELPPEIEAPSPETSWREVLHRLEGEADPEAIVGWYFQILGSGVEEWGEDDRARLLSVVERDVRSPEADVQRYASGVLRMLGDAAIPIVRDLVQRTALDDELESVLVHFLVERGLLVELATGPDAYLRDQALRNIGQTDAAITAARRLLTEHPEVLAEAGVETLSRFSEQAVGSGLAREIVEFAGSAGLDDLRRLALIRQFSWGADHAALVRGSAPILAAIQNPTARLEATRLVINSWRSARRDGLDLTEVLRQRLAAEPDATIRRRIKEALRDG